MTHAAADTSLGVVMKQAENTMLDVTKIFVVVYFISICIIFYHSF